MIPDLGWETAELGLRVIVGIVLGGTVGLERQWRVRMAGIRTNALVAGGSALFVILGAYGFEGVTADPTRVAAQVVSGIGFLGAGVILRQGLNIRGLNTAATLWCTAAIGSLAGAGLYVLATIGTVAIVAANTLMRPVSRMVSRRSAAAFAEAAAGEDENGQDDTTSFVLEAKTNAKSEPRVRALMLQAVNRPEFVLRSIGSVSSSNSVRVQAHIYADEEAGTLLQRAVARIILDPKVLACHWWPEEDIEE